MSFEDFTPELGLLFRRERMLHDALGDVDLGIVADFENLAVNVVRHPLHLLVLPCLLRLVFLLGPAQQGRERSPRDLLAGEVLTVANVGISSLNCRERQDCLLVGLHRD